MAVDLTSDSVTGSCSRSGIPGAAVSRSADRPWIPGRGQNTWIRPPRASSTEGRTLYNFDVARAAVGGGGVLVVAGGYMDVIALSEAGLPGAVAPLGTAVTADQLELMWQASDQSSRHARWQ